MSTPVRGPGGAGGSRDPVGGSEYPPTRWEEPLAGSGRNPSGETGATPVKAWEDLLAGKEKPLLVHIYRPDDASINQRIDRILKGEPQFQDGIDRRFFSNNFIRGLAVFFRTVRINGATTPPELLKQMGAERYPALLLFNLKGERTYALTDPDSTGPAELSKKMDEVLHTVAEKLCCEKHRGDTQTARFQALLDAAEKQYQAKEYAPAFLKFHEIEMEAQGPRVAALKGAAEKRQADIEREWNKDAKERKRVQDMRKLFQDAVADLKTKKFKEARRGFQAIVDTNQRRGDMHLGMETARILGELALLDGG